MPTLENVIYFFSKFRKKKKKKKKMLFKSQSNISIFKYLTAKMCAIFSLFLIDGIIFAINR